MATKKYSITEFGSTGLKRYGNTVNEEFLPQLVGPKGVRIFREMAENNAVISSVLYVMELLIRTMKWRIEPADDSAESVSDAQFVEENIDKMEQTWDEFASEVATMFQYGWAVHEVLFRKDKGGRLMWKSFAPRNQETLNGWEFDDSGKATTMLQLAPPSFEVASIPLSKCLHFKTTSRHGSPEGRSILRGAYRSWFFQKRIQEIEGIGIERDLAGLPVAYVPGNIMSSTATTEEKETYSAIKDMIVNVRRDEQEGLVIPMVFDELGHKLFSVELLSTGGKRQFDTNAIIGRYDSRIAMSMLADFILLGHESVGSFALASSKTSLFATALGAHIDGMEGVLNRSAIPMLFSANGMKREKYPRFVHGDIETQDLEELGRYISSLSSSGMALFPDQNLERHLRSIAGFPDEIGVSDSTPETPSNKESSAAIPGNTTDVKAEQPGGLS